MITLERVQAEVEAVRKNAIKLIGHGSPKEICTDAELLDEWTAGYTIGPGDETGFQVQVNLMTGEERQKGNSEKEWTNWAKVTDWDEDPERVHGELYSYMNQGYKMIEIFQGLPEENQMIMLSMMIDIFAETRKKSMPLVLAALIGMAAERKGRKNSVNDND